MSGESDLLDITMTADSSQVVQGLSSAEQAMHRAMASTEALGHGLDALTEEMARNREATEHASHGHEEHAGAIGMAVEGYALLAEAVAKAVELFNQLAETAVEAANEMDPKGAVAWTQSVEGLKSSFQTFLGQIGMQIRPAMESIMDTMSRVFNYLARLDWATVFDSLMEILTKVGTFAEGWGVKVLDFISYPFRMLLGSVEALLAGVMAQMGSVLSTLGSTSIGKKMGLDEFSGDAFKGTAEAMAKQADNLEKSFGAAAKEVGSGLGTALETAIDAAGAGGAMHRLKDALSGKGSNEDLEAVKTAQQLTVEQDLFNIKLENVRDLQEQQNIADSQHTKLIRQDAAEQKQYAMENYKLAQQGVAEAKSRLSSDEGKGDLTALAADKEALAKAVQHATDAGAAAAKQMRDAYQAEEALATGFATRAAKAKDDWEEAKKQAQEMKVFADKAGAGADIKQQAEQARQVADYQHTVYLQINGEAIQAEDTARKIKTAGAREAAGINTSSAKEAAAIQEEAAKKATEFYASTIKGLASHALGSVGGGALSGAEAGFAAAGPAGAAVGAGASLLENSAGFKKMSEALNTIFQRLADTLGRVLEPLVPVIQQIGDALQPLFTAVGNVLAPLGQMAAQVLHPLVGIIQSLSAPLIAILEPVGHLLHAISPLIGPIEQLSMMFMMFSTILDPFTIALELLAPVFDGVANVILDIVKAIASVWNSIINAIQGVVRDIANILPDKLGGSALNDFANSMDGLKINVDSAAVATQHVAEAMTNATNAAKSFSQSLFQAQTAASDKLSADEEKAAQQLKAYNDFKSRGDTKDAAAALAAYNATEKQITADSLASQIADIKRAADVNGKGMDAYDFNGGKTYQQELDAAMLAQTENDISSTTANTAATAANTAAMNNMNAVRGFDVNHYLYAAEGGSGGGSAAKNSVTSAIASKSQGAVHIYGGIQIVVESKDPNDFADKVEAALHAKNFTKHGQAVISTGGEF